SDILQPNRIDELVESTARPGKRLGECDAFGPVHEREHPGEEYVSERVHNCVKEVVDEKNRNYCCSGMMISSLRVVSRCAGPAGEQDGHANEGDEVLSTSWNEFCQEG